METGNEQCYCSVFVVLKNEPGKVIAINFHDILQHYYLHFTNKIILAQKKILAYQEFLNLAIVGVAI